MIKQYGNGYISDLYGGFDNYLRHSRVLSKMATGIGAVGSNVLLNSIIGPGVITSAGTVLGGSILAYPIYQAGYGKKKQRRKRKK